MNNYTSKNIAKRRGQILLRRNAAKRIIEKQSKSENKAEQKTENTLKKMGVTLLIAAATMGVMATIFHYIL